MNTTEMDISEQRVQPAYLFCVDRNIARVG